MPENNADDVKVLVDLGSGRVRTISRKEDVDAKVLEELSGRSKTAVDKSLSTIGWVADKTKAILDGLHDKPDTVEVEFGIQITAEAGVIVAKSETQLHITAKLVWNKPKEDANDQSG